MAESSGCDVNKHCRHETDSHYLNQTKPKFPQYADSTKRKGSYLNWPKRLSVPPDDLVNAGFSYTGVKDKVRCFYCSGEIENWERGDSPWEEHARWFPSCPYVHCVMGKEYVERVKRGEKPDQDMPNTWKQVDSPAVQACVENGCQMIHVKIAILVYLGKHGGKRNFEGADLWEILLDIKEQTNSVFCEFMSQMSNASSRNDTNGVGDSVRCLYCCGRLRKCERGDNPACLYVHLVKGKEYMERVNWEEKPDPVMPKNEDEYSHYDPINYPAAQACVQMGFQEDLVKQAIIVYLKKSGGNLNFKGAELCKILFDIEE